MCSNFKKIQGGSGTLVPPRHSYGVSEVHCTVWRSTACVSVAPRIEPFSFGDPVYDGQSTQVTCFVSEGDTPLDLFWTFSGRAGPAASPLRGGVSVNKMGSKVSMLYIDAASSSRHAGNYTCVATNRAGRADRTATLNVHGIKLHGGHYQPPLPRLYRLPSSPLLRLFYIIS